MGFFRKDAPLQGSQVNEAAAAALEQRLAAYGPVTHSFSQNGYPMRSVGLVNMGAYNLLVTFGLSELITPAHEGMRAEYSLAIPAADPIVPWADAFLRSQVHSMLAQRTDVKVGECIPFDGVPITCLPFGPEHHASMPPSTIVGMCIADDPWIPSVDTPAGRLEIRRIVGIDTYELDRALTWNPSAFVELIAGIDPLLLTPLQRPSYLTQQAFRETVEQRAQKEGSTVEGLRLDMPWQQGNGMLRIQLPQGPGMVRAVNALRGRIGFGRPLNGFSSSAPLTFSPGAPGMSITPQVADLAGDLKSPPISTVLEALEAGAAYVDLPIQAPTPRRARADFFARVTACVKSHELDTRLNIELKKLLDEAKTIAALQSEVAEVDRAADRSALDAVIRTLRFARSTDQATAIEPMIKTLSGQ